MSVHRGGHTLQSICSTIIPVSGQIHSWLIIKYDFEHVLNSLKNDSTVDAANVLLNSLSWAAETTYAFSLQGVTSCREFSRMQTWPTRTNLTVTVVVTNWYNATFTGDKYNLAVGIHDNISTYIQNIDFYPHCRTPFLNPHAKITSDMS